MGSYLTIVANEAKLGTEAYVNKLYNIYIEFQLSSSNRSLKKKKNTKSKMCMSFKKIFTLFSK